MADTTTGARFAIEPPVSPMLSQAVNELPVADGMLYEPKWDGFRCVVFFAAPDHIILGSRNEKPLNRYFPELVAVLPRALPAPGVYDGEIVIPGPKGLDFEALLQRIHPAASRARKLAAETPAAFVVFDLLGFEGEDWRLRPQRERRAKLETLFEHARPPVHLTQATTDPELARTWFRQFEGAGLDGVMAKPGALPYCEGKRVMFKIKHARTADCVVAGTRPHKDGRGVGSLLLGLYEGEKLQHVGVASGFAAKLRVELENLLAPLREGAAAGHPWLLSEAEAEANGRRIPGGPSRWTGDRNTDWEPVKPTLVAEVAYDHLQGARFRHATRLLHFRPDRDPRSCTYQQLEVPVPFALEDVLGKKT